MTDGQLTAVILTTVLSSIGVLVSVLSLGWKVYVKIDNKIDTKIDKLADAHNNLANELSELRGSLLERFRLRSNQQLLDALDEKINRGDLQ